MAGPLTPSITVNPAANTLYAAAFISNLVLNGGSATYETRSFSSGGTQTVFGGLEAGVHDWTSGSNSLSGMIGSVFGEQWSSSLGNNNSDNLGPYGAASVTYTSGNYISLRVFSYGSGHPLCVVNVRRSGAWSNIATLQNAVFVRRSGAWFRKQSQGQMGWIRRSGAWNQLFFQKARGLLVNDTFDTFQIDPQSGMAQVIGWNDDPLSRALSGFDQGVNRIWRQWRGRGA